MKHITGKETKYKNAIGIYVHVLYCILKYFSLFVNMALASYKQCIRKQNNHTNLPRDSVRRTVETRAQVQP